MAILPELLTHFLDPPMSASHPFIEKAGTPLFKTELHETSGHILEAIGSMAW